MPGRSAMSGGDVGRMPNDCGVPAEDAQKRLNDYQKIHMIARLLIVFPAEELAKRGLCYERAWRQTEGVAHRRRST